MNKQILSTIIALMAFTASFAQLTISPADTVTFNGTFTNDLAVGEEHGYITNTSNKADTVIWYASVVNKPDDWEVSLCDTNNCYFLFSPATLDRYEFIAQPNIPYPLKYGASPYCVTGSASYKVHFWLKSDSAASAKAVTFVANYTGTCLTDINNNTADQLNVYPSPFTNSFTIDGVNSIEANSKLKIFDVAGKAVYENQFTGNATTLTFTPAIQNAGVYFLTIENPAGKRIYSKNITRQ